VEWFQERLDEYRDMLVDQDDTDGILKGRARELRDVIAEMMRV
jgi:hypothetical protein